MSDHENEQPEPAPEGVNLLGTPARIAANTDATRRRYAIGPFGQTWLWTISIATLAMSLYKLIAGPLLAATLPTTQGTVVRWITIPGRAITYLPRVSFQVAGRTYEFTAGTAVGTLHGAPKTVTVSYVPFAPSAAIWNSGQWWAAFFDTYLMIGLILGGILFAVAIYQYRIRSYWTPRAAQAGKEQHRRLIGIGAVVAALSALWLLSGYLTPASWFIPPTPNLIAAFFLAIGTALLVTGLHYRRQVRQV